MLLNFIKTAFRYLLKNISFTIINIIGLTAGIAAFLLIALYVQNEWSYDKHIPDHERLFRMVGAQEPYGLDVQHVAITSGGWASFLRDNVPDVEEVFRFLWASNINEAGDEVFNEDTYYSEGNVVSRLGLVYLSGGDPSAMLATPNTAVISRGAAMRMFKTEDAVGMTFRNANKPYTVTGVYENDNVLSHLKFEILLSIVTVENEMTYLRHLGNNSLVTYLVLRPGADVYGVEDIINTHYREEGMQDGEQGFMQNTFYLQSAGDIYLKSGHIKFQLMHREGNISSVRIFVLVALLVLAIACINFINLSTANSVKRAREVGVRKVLGAGRGKLALQFVGESFLLTLGSIFLSLVLLELIIPEFNAMLGTALRIDFLNNPVFNAGLLAILIAVGLVSGLYPGLVLSKFPASVVMKMGAPSGRHSTAMLRKILVIIQFSVSTVLIVATIVVMQQTSFMQRKDRGYNPEKVVTVYFNDDISYEKIEDFRTRLLGLPQVVAAGIASNYNGVAGRQSDIVIADSLQTRLMTRFGYVNPDFFPAMGMEVVRGRNFSRESGTDIRRAAIVNEAACRALGWEEPIGQRIMNGYYEDEEYFTVVGVVRDYHYYTIREPIEPAIYLYQPAEMHAMTVRFSGEDPQAFVQVLEDEYRAAFPGTLFTSRLLEEVLARQTRAEESTMKIFLWFSVLCIVISCLGLFGLTSYITNQRRKEISIRKVLGGTVMQVNVMLLRSFVRLVALAALLAIPLAWIFMNRWLENYPYRIQLGVLQFGTALFIILSIAVATVLYYSTRAAMQNPSDHLKYE